MDGTPINNPINNDGIRPYFVPPANGSWRREKSAEDIHEHNNEAAKRRLFVMKKHDATRLHYDLRLGHKGILLSWAMPDGPSCCSDHAREAVQMSDHSREHAFFEGCKTEGYGAGTILLWDWGTWEPVKGCQDVDAALRRGKLTFHIHGEKLKGKWTLRRLSRFQGNRRNPYWILTKEKDSFECGGEIRPIVEEMPNSVSTKRSLKEIEKDWEGGVKVDPLQGKLFQDHRV